jgi:RNA polymerase sigma-70 factor (ECF subfamily)
VSEATESQIPVFDSVIRIDEETLLVQRCQKGDTAAMESLILRYQNRIYNVILKICANRDDAAELSQQVFVNIIENIKSFKQQSGFYTWAFRIAVNLTLSHCKKKGKIVFGSLDDSNDDGEEGKGALRQIIHNDVAPDPAVVAQNKELCRLITKQLEKLTDEHRIILVLRDIEGMDYAKISQVTGVELGTVKSRLSRARDALRRILETSV